jgi:AcrR family transcriptional regulator
MLYNTNMASHTKQEPLPATGRILDAAMRLAERRGATFGMDELAALVGVSRATLYRAVFSKDKLLKRLADERGLKLALPKKDSRERVLNAAAAVFERRGLEGATVEDIANQAGVSAVTVYRRFKSKNGLLKALLEERSPRRAARALPLGSGRDLESDLTEFAIMALASVSANAGLLHIALGASPDRWRVLRRLRDEPRGTTAALRNFFAEQIRLGRLPQQDPQRLAVAFTGLGLTFGYIAPRFQDLPLEDLAATGRFMARLFLNGVMATGT